MIAQEKAAGVLDTPATASLKQRTTIVSKLGNVRNPFAPLQAQLALFGRALARANFIHDGRINYVLLQRDGPLYFCHLIDVRAHLAQIGGNA